MASKNDVVAEDELDPVLERLYEAESTMPLRAGAEARVLSGVMQSLAAANPVGPSADGSLHAEQGLSSGKSVASAGKTALTVVMSAIVGGAIAVSVDRSVFSSQSSTPVSEKTSVRNAAAPVPTPQDAAPPVALVDAAAPAANVNKVQPARKMHSKKKPPPAAEDDKDAAAKAGSEAHLIDRARIALRRGLYDDALLALMQHERRFPDGQMEEERDSLAIETYAAKGEERIARRRIQKYRQDYPKGLHRARVDRSAASLKK